MTHICVSKLTIIGSDNGLSPGRRQAIIWTNVGILLIRTLGTNFSEILGEIHSFSISKMHLKMTSAKWRLFGLGLNELRGYFNSHVSTYCTANMAFFREGAYLNGPILKSGLHNILITASHFSWTCGIYWTLAVTTGLVKWARLEDFRSSV